MTVWVQISSGRGPEECCWVVSRLASALTQEGQAAGVQVELLSATPSPAKGYQSAILALEGSDAAQVAAGWEGTIQWIGQSPFRPRHKRKNWFVSAEIFHGEDDSAAALDERDLDIQAMRAQGPGGQHVNKSRTAVRVTHRPTGIAVKAEEERSQYLNKKLALARLVKALDGQQQARARDQQQSMWTQHNQLIRGNPVRVYRGAKFALDPRTSP